MGKFSNTGFLNVEWKTKDNNGEEKSYIFKPLPFANYPSLYDLVNTISGKGIKEGMSSEDAFKAFDAELISKLLALEKTMVKNSYPDIPESEIEEFVMGNVFELMEPLFSFIERKKPR